MREHADGDTRGAVDRDNQRQVQMVCRNLPNHQTLTKRQTFAHKKQTHALSPTLLTPPSLSSPYTHMSPHHQVLPNPPPKFPSNLLICLHLLHPHSRVFPHLHYFTSPLMDLPVAILVLCNPLCSQKGLSNANLTCPSTSSPDPCFTAFTGSP